jgi:hypothetical protein
MISLAQLWLPIVLSSVFVFAASSILHMVLRFWHGPDAKGFANEDEVAAAIRNGGATGPSLYMIPYCKPEMMKDPAFQQKFTTGPVGVLFLRRAGPMNMGAFFGQWIGFCLLVSLVCAVLALPVLPAGAPHHHVFHVIGLAAAMAYAFGVIPDAIWWGHPWKSALKHLIDGVIYGVVTGLTFAWLWPAV